MRLLMLASVEVLICVIRQPVISLVVAWQMGTGRGKTKPIHNSRQIRLPVGCRDTHSLSMHWRN
jgi:hypothetical protein